MKHTGKHARPRTGLMAVAASIALVMVAASCSSSDPATSSSAAAVADPAALLGPSKPATGTPIKIGLIGDGKSPALDTTAISEVFKASVAYANDHLGGINGHKIEVVECSTNNTPSDATTCGVQMVKEQVAAVLVPVSAQDAAVYKAMQGSGIPYVSYVAGAQEIITGTDVFLFVNPIATLAGPAKIAKDSNVKKAGIILVDVPAATGPLKAIAEPIYEKAGVELDVVSISPQTADMTPQIQQAMSEGIEQFAVIGPDEFNAQGIKTLRQLGFSGKILMVTAPSQGIVDAVPGGLDGVVYLTSATADPNDKDVQLYDAVVQTYLSGTTPSTQSSWSFALLLAFIKALDGNEAAVDAAGITAALGSMPKPLPLPLGAGLTFHCGAKVVAFLPSICTDNALWTTLDAQGDGGRYQQLDVKDYLVLG